MTAFTHPIYQEGPLAQAIAAFQQQEEQARLTSEELRVIRQKENAANIEGLMSIAKERFGDLWLSIEPYIVKSFVPDWEHRLSICVLLPQVWPFTISQERGGYTRINFDYPSNHADPVTFSANAPIDQVRFAYFLLEGHQMWLTQEAERQVNDSRHAAKLAYVQAWRDYERDRISTIAKNEMALTILQEEYTTSFPVWELVYGITAHHDEEGEFYADTRSVYILKPDCDEDGFIPVLDDTGKVTHRKYYSPVYISGPLTFHAEPGSTHCGYMHIKEANASLYFSPLLKYAEVLTRVRSWVEANMTPLPDPPLYAAFGLDERPDRWEIEHLEKQLAGEGDQDMPF